MNTAFKIKEVLPRIFLFEFKSNYDMCMHFLRYQEYYECSSPRFRGKAFEIFDFMKWYSFKYGGGVFTYADDWDGFNLPSPIIIDLWEKQLIPDKNIYDYEMFNAWKQCNIKTNDYSTQEEFKFYIIGAVKNNGALTHEVSHGLFYLYPEYKKEMTKLVRALDPEIKKEVYALLKKLGYTPKVYVDELAAYFATGLLDSFPDRTKWAAERKPFAKFYRKFVKNLKSKN
jgi:hypothetical protein